MIVPPLPTIHPVWLSRKKTEPRFLLYARLTVTSIHVLPPSYDRCTSPFEPTAHPLLASVKRISLSGVFVATFRTLTQLLPPSVVLRISSMSWDRYLLSIHLKHPGKDTVQIKKNIARLELPVDPTVAGMQDRAIITDGPSFMIINKTNGLKRVALRDWVLPEPL